MSLEETVGLGGTGDHEAVGVLHYGDLEAGWDRRPRILDGISDQKAGRDLVHSSMRPAQGEHLMPIN